jgi:4-amino-4-deoxy-L-arabinose transferase-like glycosyltransferase
MSQRPWLWLLLICGVNFMFMLGGHSLWDVDEPNNAVCAREMLLAHNWWVPMFNGGLRFDKPILLYWLMMPSYALFGINEFSARLPSALSMTALTMVIFYFGRRIIDARSGLIAAGLFATCLHIIVISRAATPDPVFMLCLCTSLLALLCFYLEGLEKSSLLYVAYIAMGFGVLAKGPVAVAMPVMIWGGFLLLMGQWRRIWAFRPWMGLAIVLAIALPWYITVGVLTDGEWLRGFLLHHNIDRFTHSLQGHRGFPGFYLVTFFVGWFPWNGLLVAALALGPWRLQTLRQVPLRLYLLTWIGVFFVFFSIAGTRLPNYMLPAFPAAALLIALWLRDAEPERAQRWLLYPAALLSVIVLVGAAGALQHQWPGEWQYGLCFLPVVIAVLWSLWRRATMLPAIGAGMMASILVLAGWTLPALDHHKVAEQFAHAADHAGFSGRELATYHYFQPSLLFYHGGRLPLLRSMPQLEKWLTEGRAVVMPQEALKAFPPAILPYLVIHHRAYGLYARKWLILVSLKPIEGVSWQKI